MAFRGITKQYGNHVVVNDINLQIDGGEFISLLGPSGSGKTALLMMLAGFTNPRRDRSWSTGNARSRSRQPAQPGRGVPELSARELIVAALARVRMSGFEERYPSQLSGGQQQRMALARATVFDSLRILMDESLSALDRKLLQETQVEIKDPPRDLDKTIIYLTHDQEEALTIEQSPER